MLGFDLGTRPGLQLSHLACSPHLGIKRRCAVLLIQVAACPAAVCLPWQLPCPTAATRQLPPVLCCPLPQEFKGRNAPCLRSLAGLDLQPSLNLQVRFCSAAGEAIKNRQCATCWCGVAAAAALLCLGVDASFEMILVARRTMARCSGLRATCRTTRTASPSLGQSAVFLLCLVGVVHGHTTRCWLEPGSMRF